MEAVITTITPVTAGPGKHLTAVDPHLRLLSVVEALTVTGPVKPLLMFSALARRGVDGHRPVSHRLLTTRRGAASNSHNSDELRIAAAAVGLDCQIIPERRAFDRAVLEHMATQIRDYCPDIIETHDCKSHLLLYLLRLRHRDIRRARWVAFHHGYTQVSWRVAAYQQLDRLTLRAADAVVTLCKPFAAALQARGVNASRISVISNALTARDRPQQSEVDELRRAHGIAPGDILVLAVGRLSREKAHRDLIAALSDAINHRPDARLRVMLVGDGPECDRLKALAASLGDRVLFAGHIRDPWVYYHAADIFVLCSLTEGSPLVLLEAMSARLPIIASAVGGVPETLEHERTALLIPPADRAALREGLICLAADPALRLRLGGAAARAVLDFSPNSYAVRLLGVYARVMSGET